MALGLELLRNVRERLYPRSKECDFYGLFRAQARHMVEGAEGLSVALTDWPNHKGTIRPRLRGIRDDNEVLRDEVTRGLSQIFLTPLPQEDLAHLNISTHALVKAISTPANFLVMYKIDYIPPPLALLGQVLLDQTRELASVLSDLPTSMKNGYGKNLHAVDRLEHEADDVKNGALGELSLFEETATVAGLSLAHRMRHIYDLTEGATDVAKHCADALRDVAVRNVSFTSLLKGLRSS